MPVVKRRVQIWERVKIEFVHCIANWEFANVKMTCIKMIAISVYQRNNVTLRANCPSQFHVPINLKHYMAFGIHHKLVSVRPLTIRYHVISL